MSVKTRRLLDVPGRNQYGITAEDLKGLAESFEKRRKAKTPKKAARKRTR